MNIRTSDSLKNIIIEEGENQMVVMDMETSEKTEQMLNLRKRVLQAEQERLDGASTLSVSEARKKIIERMKNV
ncbi:MAG: type II toxin-antitoxin system Phd/YefM family antitoxin [Agathobacter sp.]|nr:type II toxin-antitoxin system Phd/YefM family antitoxin [Agathobacter sp.]MBQ3559931.1 type II toxin-antitoxin system Phd/YefM family antitoxin [Agathobacter sp.]